MTATMTQCLLRLVETDYTLSDYQADIAPRWCAGCGDTGILTAIQRLCRDENLPPEKTVFVSGIGCSSRLPHYMNAYGFHGLHGRAAAHWIHAIRYNMNLTVLLHDNNVYGLTKKQASPTSPRGFKSNTTPRGNYLDPLNPLTVTLGVANASFVAQAVDWIPDLLYDVISQAHRHRGLSFVRILQRCPEFMNHHFEDAVRDPTKTRILVHGDGLRLKPELSRIYRNQETHDPLDMPHALALAALTDEIPVGILYRNPAVPCYEDLREAERPNTPDLIRTVLDEEFDRVTIWPEAEATPAGVE
jgi:2-oxoglutarate ferredoxin oxidoreductase subunit beta